MAIESPLIELGNHSDLQFTDDTVIKTTRITYPDAAAAQCAVDELVTYANSFDGEPLRVARLLGACVADGSDGYRMVHTYERVNGPSLARQGSLADGHESVRLVLEQINGMRTYGGDPDSLLVPGDFRAENIHVDATGPALIDIYPALTRHADGSFPVERVGGKSGEYASYAAWVTATKSGEIVRILSGAIDRGPLPILYALRTLDDWAYDTLPPASEMDPRVRETIRREIRLHFVPYLSRMAMHKLAGKIH